MTVIAHDTRHDRAPALPLAGWLYAAAAATSFGLSGVLARGLMDLGWTPGAATVVRVLGGFVVLAVPAARLLRGRWGALRTNLGFIAVYGLMAVALVQYCYFNAVQHLDVGVAILIEFTSPVVVVLYLWSRYGLAPRLGTGIGAVIAAVGLILLIDLRAPGELSVTGIAWALGAMLGSAAFFILSAEERRGLPPLVLAAGGLLVGGLVLAAGGLLNLVPMSFGTGASELGGVQLQWWQLVLLLTVVSAALAYSMGIEATRRLGARLASFVALSEAIAAVAFAAWLLSEIPSPPQLVGAVLILAGVVFVKLDRPAGQH